MGAAVLRAERSRDAGEPWHGDCGVGFGSALELRRSGNDGPGL